MTEERLRFVARLLDGEGMSEVCRDFGISRKTGYKIFNRYKDDGLDALADRSRKRRASSTRRPRQRFSIYSQQLSAMRRRAAYIRWGRHFPVSAMSHPKWPRPRNSKSL